MPRSTSNLEKYLEGLPVLGQDIFKEMTSSPMLNQLFASKKALQYESSYKKFSNDRWNMNPQLFCQETYNIQEFYPIILIVNNLGSIYEFVPKNMPDGICTPKQERIGFILKSMNLEVNL